MQTAELTATEQLISRVFARRAEITRLSAEQEEDEKRIIALGAGKHSGANPAHSLTVAAAAAAAPGKISYALPDGAEAVEQARKLADEKFGILFERVVSFVPIAGFEHVVPTHLTPARARDLLALCRHVGKAFAGKKAHILWPKA